jgi:glycosyltransferase involved in cell wall biosynthesis
MSCHHVLQPRVVIDLEKLRHINCGLGRFSLHLAEGIVAEFRDRIAPVFLMPQAARSRFPEGRFDTLPVQPWRKEFVQRWTRPIVRPFLGHPPYAVWHMTNQMSRYEPLDPRVPVLLTVHDLTFIHKAPQDRRTSEIERKRADTQRRVDRATAIAVDSRFVADDLRRELTVGGRPIHVIPLGLAAAPQASTSRPAFLADERPFLLSIGNALAHKNFHVLFDLIELLPNQTLVIAGSMQGDYGDFLRREVSRRRLDGVVVMPGEVNDGDRQWLYEQCAAFVFPSLSEGFGLPVLEAMHAGRPVFVSRRTSLPEIAGEHGFYFDSFVPQSMATVLTAGMARFAAEPGRAAAQRAHAATFSWHETVRRYVELYEAIAARPGDMAA